MRSAVVAAGMALLAAACTAGDSTPTTTAAPTSTAVQTTTTTALPSTTVVATTTTTTMTTTTIPAADSTMAVEAVVGGFSQPVLALAHEGRLFVVDQPGLIWVVDDGEPEVFLDIRQPVAYGGERGLLGLAFHPEYEDRFYVNYTDEDGATRIAEYRYDESGVVPGSARTVLRISQPARNHNGGGIAFGPDGSLWVGMGDGGGSDDRYGNGQRGDTLLGAMLRIEVGPDVDPYGVADDYGFEAAEVWAIGVRNPWRFAFDGRDLWIADVGQNAREEINRVSVDDRGLNFGWPVFEGFDCYRGGSRCDDATPYTAPVYQYRHPEGCSVTGGSVYRGSAMPQLAGHYFFSDWCGGFIRSIAPDGEVFDWTPQTGTFPRVTSFGVDAGGELLVVSGEGTVYRLVPG